MKRVALVALAALAVGAGTADACGDGWMAANLRATAAVKAALRVAYLRANPRVAAASVGGPLSGHTYYGRYTDTYYAVAMFGRYPTVFVRKPHGAWQVRRQTHGGVCTNVVPGDLLQHHWWLAHWGGECYVQPTT